jgi:hypothetical protein
MPGTPVLEFGDEIGTGDHGGADADAVVGRSERRVLGGGGLPMAPSTTSGGPNRRTTGTAEPHVEPS